MTGKTPDGARRALLLATNNADKLREMRGILSPLGFELVTPGELGDTAETDETGETFEENARLKARAFCEKFGMPSVADDSGLCVDALGGAPGVRSARFGGALSNEARLRHLLKCMETEGNRAARFVTYVICAFPDGGELVASGEERGELLRERRGESGFSYDPVFYYPPLGKTNAEMTPDEKNSVSARGAALRALAGMLPRGDAEPASRGAKEDKTC
ncbi:MAG: RdgB/HAM1 family non-canonical purine NTP pyrophosphatase [Oscillospiraceae bacterium]|jgi:XTP/dITP diphosphohydrolase|nr:RdgB/HAM1 family non-canonical purine NTP pyrophosphatase [Oscillospiraceae bacterium]